MVARQEVNERTRQKLINREDLFGSRVREEIEKQTAECGKGETDDKIVPTLKRCNDLALPLAE